MTSSTVIKLSQSKQKPKSPCDYFPSNPCKILALSGLLLYLIIYHFINYSTPLPKISPPSQCTNSPTNITHLVFGLVTSVKTWKDRKPYVESWWRPNVTRGYLFLDEAPGDDLLPWPSTSPTLRVSDNYTELERESKHEAPIMIRMVLSILETFREGDEGVRWYVIGFDDSIFFVDNLVDVLGNYDHNKYVYVGGHSENLKSDMFFSFEMGFGGAGIALSYPLVKAMAKELKECIKRYPYASSADLITQFCVDEFGVPLSAEKGIHQIDLRGDISGFLSAHPQVPLVSLHHFDEVDPIFPSMDRIQSTKKLMEAAEFDQSRLLQQTVCYHRRRNWSFAVSWGYSAHIYESIYPRTMLKRPLETFVPWIGGNSSPPFFLFNTRWPCETPNVFFFQSIAKTAPGNQILTTYVRSSPPEYPNCTFLGNRFALGISEIRVFSPATKFANTWENINDIAIYISAATWGLGGIYNILECCLSSTFILVDGRSECCDVEHEDGNNLAQVKLRTCKDDEIIA